jgi:hypothetical protein
MGYGGALLDGIARHTAAGGLGIYRKDGVFAEGEQGITISAFPETPDELLAITRYQPEYSWTASGTRVLTATRVQFRWRRRGHPLEGEEVYDRLIDLYGRRSNLVLGDVVASSLFLSYTPLGRDANSRWQYSANFQFSGLTALSTPSGE